MWIYIAILILRLAYAGVIWFEQGSIIKCEISTGKNQRTDDPKRHYRNLKVNTHARIWGFNRARISLSYDQDPGGENSMEN